MYRNFSNSHTNSKSSLFVIGLGKSEILNINPVRYRPNLFFSNIYNLVKIMWSVLLMRIGFILRGRQTQIFKIQNTKQNNFILEALNFEFVHPVK